MEYNNIDKIVKIDAFSDEKSITQVNKLLNEGWILLNIEYSREVRASTIVSYILGHLKTS